MRERFAFMIYISTLSEASQFSAFTTTVSLLCLLSQASHRKSSGFSAVSQLFSERWPSTAANRSFSGPTTERNIDFELDVRVEIDSGKCVLHPTTQQPEHEDISFRRYDEKHLLFWKVFLRAGPTFPAVSCWSDSTFWNPLSIFQIKLLCCRWNSCVCLSSVDTRNVLLSSYNKTVLLVGFVGAVSAASGVWTRSLLPRKRSCSPPTPPPLTS